MCVRVDECLVPEDRLECKNNISRLKTLVETCEVSVTTTAVGRWEEDPGFQGQHAQPPAARTFASGGNMMVT